MSRKRQGRNATKYILELSTFLGSLVLCRARVGENCAPFGLACMAAAELVGNFYTFIPDEIIEAAVIDGASVYGIFPGIMLPLSLNTIMTVLAMNFITVWNDYSFSLVFINSTELKTISVGLSDFIGPRGLKDWGATYAAIALSILPTLVIYFSLNKKMTAGLTLGAVK